jgi:hypothetical protein
MSDIELALAASLFSEGFRLGCGPRFFRMSDRERQLLKRSDRHFVAGVKAGRDAARAARDVYRASLIQVESSTNSP